MSKCIECGYQLKPHDNFCKKCGTKAEPAVGVPCESCGYDLTPEDKFCKKCGTVRSGGQENDRDNDDAIAPSIFAETRRIDLSSDGDEELKYSFKKIVEEHEGATDEDYYLKYEKIQERTVDPSASTDTHKAIGDLNLEKTPIIEESSNRFKKEESDDFTILRPENFDEILQREERAHLSNQKKKLIEKSKTVQDDLNHVVNTTQETKSEEALSDTQKIKQEAIENQRLEDRRKRIVTDDERRMETFEVGEEKPGNKVKKPKGSIFVNWILPAIAALVVLVLAVMLLQFNNSTVNVVADFEKAITDRDARKLGVIAASDQGDLTQIQEDALMKLLESDEMYRTAVLESIKEDAVHLKEDVGFKGDRPFRLERVGKKFLLFNDYRVVFDELKVETLLPENMQLVIDGRVIGGEEPKLMTPGIYIGRLQDPQNEKAIEVKVMSLGDAEERTALIDLLKEEIEVIQETPVDDNAKEPEEPIDPVDEGSIEAGDRVLTIESNHPEAMVYRNGKNSGLSVQQFNELLGKKLVDGDKIKIGREFPWGTGFSEEVSLSSEEVIQLEVSLQNETTRDELIRVGNQMLKEDSLARRNMDIHQFKSIIEPELTASKQIIQNGLANNQTYYRVYDSMTYDLDSFEVIDNGDGTYSGYIGGVVIYRATEYPFGADMPDVSGLALYENIIGIHYTFGPDYPTWMVNMWGTTYRAINNGNTEKFELND